MASLKDKIIGLKNPWIVRNFQEICQIEVLSNDKQNNEDISPSTYLTSDGLHKRLVHKNGLFQNSKNGLVQNGNLSQNGHIQSDSDSDTSRTPEKVKFIVHNKVLFWIFRCGAELGNELFYLTFFTFCLWNLNSLVTRQMAIIWHAGMYLGQAAKDIVCWPRPSSPPCARLELRYEEEYGMPSTHATVGVIIPFAWILVAHRHYEVCWCTFLYCRYKKFWIYLYNL